MKHVSFIAIHKDSLAEEVEDDEMSFMLCFVSSSHQHWKCWESVNLDVNRFT